MTPKDLKWIGSARADIQALPDEAKRQLGYDLRLVQLGQTPRSWRPMPSVGSGVTEIRVRTEGAFRLMYVAKFAEAAFVIHVFQKKSRKTSPLDIELARVRYASLLRALKEK